MGYFHGQLGRERERTEASYGTECVRAHERVRACVWPCDMRLLALHRVIHAFINTVLSGTTCDGAILISAAAKTNTAALMRCRCAADAKPGKLGRFP